MIKKKFLWEKRRKIKDVTGVSSFLSEGETRQDFPLSGLLSVVLICSMGLMPSVFLYAAPPSQGIQSGSNIGEIVVQKTGAQGQIKGRIVDYETQTPLEGVSVLIAGSSQSVESGPDGTYELDSVSVGFYSLTFQLSGYYSDTRADIIVRSSRITFCNIQMLAARRLEEEVDVTADYFVSVPTQPGSHREFSQEEIRRDAGTAGDSAGHFMRSPV